MRHVVLDDAQREQLALWVLGLLDADEAAAVAAHVGDGCAACAGEAAALRAVTDDLAHAAVPQDPPAGLRDRVRAAVQADGRDYRFARAGDGGWHTVAPGIARRDLGEDAATRSRSYLLRLNAGARAGRHLHAAAEHCLVIEGDVEVAGRVLGLGDFHLAAPGTAHDGIASRGGCLLLIVESAPIP
jgi:anti-sigma factor ChrR (cupin superfamily)